MSEESEQAFIKAAGGLVWREVGQGRRLLVVHRARYDDWSLPKGKLEEGETWPQAARREIAEETGFLVNQQSFAGVTTYYHNRRPKVVLFWNMVVAGQIDRRAAEDQAQSEVDEIRWFDVAEAERWLTYPAERDLVKANWPEEH